MGLLRVSSTNKLVRRNSFIQHIMKKDSTLSSTENSLDDSDYQDESRHFLIQQDYNNSANDEEFNEIWDSIPEYSKNDLLVGKHLGKGTFSDVFEVVAIVGGVENNKSNTFSDKDELDTLIETKFSKFAPLSDCETHQENAPLTSGKRASSYHDNIRAAAQAAAAAKPEQQDIAASVSMGRPVPKRQVTYAMKCLRPQVRSDAVQFKVGIEDLVHETTMLVSLDHPNIVKLHGKMAGCAGAGAITNSFHVSNGYFVLLDRLTNTLDDRIEGWKKLSSSGKKFQPSITQAKIAGSIADAISYLHSKNIVFRDLKPQNVGFDSKGTLKLFDFGFAAKVSQSSSSMNTSLLYDECGTMRYMAPEVGLEQGHSFPADVYSFGILLWEMCSLKKPYGDIKSSAVFHRAVFKEDTRPKLKKGWPQVFKELMEDCWARSPDRPTMDYIKMILQAHARELSCATQEQYNSNERRKSFSTMFRILSK